MAMTNEEIYKELSGKTVMDIATLIKMCEEGWGVSAAAPVAMAAAPGAAAGPGGPGGQGARGPASAAARDQRADRADARRTGRPRAVAARRPAAALLRRGGRGPGRAGPVLR